MKIVDFIENGDNALSELKNESIVDLIDWLVD